MHSVTQKKYSNRELVIYSFLLSLIIRLIYGVVYYMKAGTSGFSDDWAYINFAEAMFHQGIFVNDISGLTQTKSAITPFYPFIIFLSFKIFGIKYLPLIILNALFSSFITYLIYYLGKYTFNEIVGLLSSLWTIFYINTIRWVPMLLKENLVQLLFAILIILLVLFITKNRGFLNIALISIIFVILIHTDERYIVYFIPIVFIVVLIKGMSIKKRLLSILYLSITILILSTPWLIRNYKVYNRPVILSERTAIITDKIFNYKNDNYFSQEIQISELTLDSIKKGIPVYDMTMYNIIQRGLSFGIEPRKYSSLEKMYIDLKELWRPFRFSDMWVSEGFRPEGKWSFVHNISLISTYGILLPFMVIGIYKSLKNKNYVSYLLVFIILLHTLLHITVILSQNRYRIPIDIIVIVFAFYGITEIYSKFKMKIVSKINTEE
jgi:hypothetical protein